MTIGPFCGCSGAFDLVAFPFLWALEEFSSMKAYGKKLPLLPFSSGLYQTNINQIIIHQYHRHGKTYGALNKGHSTWLLNQL